MTDRLRFYKDPLDTIAYTLDWANELGTKTIISSNWSVSSGSLTINSTSNMEQTASVLVSGGNAGSLTRLSNYITDSSGIVFGRVAEIFVQNRLTYVEQRVGEKLSYTVDWNDLTAEIISQQWLSVAGLTYSAQSFSNKLATITVNGGSIDTCYPVKHQVTTLSGQTLHKGFAIRIV